MDHHDRLEINVILLVGLINTFVTFCCDICGPKLTIYLVDAYYGDVRGRLSKILHRMEYRKHGIQRKVDSSFDVHTTNYTNQTS